MPIVELFKALGDSTRLRMVERLSAEGSHTLTSLSKGLHLTRQGARKHLQVLADSHIITLRLNGRSTDVHLNRHALDKGRDFIAKLELKWDRRLERLKKVGGGEVK